MTTKSRRFPILTAITGTILLLAALNWRVAPEFALKWIVLMLVFPLIHACALTLSRRVAAGDDALRHIRNGLAMAGALIAAALAFKLARAFSFADGDGDGALRAFGAAYGVILAMIGNRLPKILSPLTEQRCAPAAAQSVQRFSGWTLMLAGLAYAAAWLALPVAQAGGTATAICFFAVLLVAARLAWAMRCKIARPLERR